MMNTEPEPTMPTSPTPTTETPGKESNETFVLVPRRVNKKTGRFIPGHALDLAVGGREQLIERLEHGPHDQKMELLLNMLADPGRAHMSIDTLCKDAGLTGREFMKIFREASIAKAFTEANLTLAEKLHSVVTDVADKATNHTEPCPCTLGGLQDANPECRECKGRGLQFYRGDIDHQKMVFESTGLVKKGGGVNVQVNQQVAVGAGGLFERFVKATDAAAYGQKVVDAEIMHEQET